MDRYFYWKLTNCQTVLDLQLANAKLKILLMQIKKQLMENSQEIGGEPFPSARDCHIINQIQNHLIEKEKS